MMEEDCMDAPDRRRTQDTQHSATDMYWYSLEAFRTRPCSPSPAQAVAKRALSAL
jgi:hypothetical protein